MQGPRLYRFFNYETMTLLPAPTAGWNPDANPWEIADTQAPVLDNALIRPGRVVPRGSIIYWADTGQSPPVQVPLNPSGVQPVPGGSKIVVGCKLPGTPGFVDPWFAPIVRPPLANALAVPWSVIPMCSGGTTITQLTLSQQTSIGPRGITFEGARLYIGYGTSTAPIADSSGTYFAQTTNLCSINSAGTCTAFTNAPRGAIDLKGYQSRIWLLGGVDDPAGGTTFNPLTLFFSNPIGPGGGNSASFADWKDPVAGTTNKIVMDGDTTDPGVGLAVVRNGLLIFRYASVWLLKGSTTANYTLVPVSRDTGCIDPRSIVETDEGVYYMSRQGLMLTNGVTVKNISGSVLHTLQSAIEIFTGSVKSGFGGYCTCALASAGQIVVSMGVPSVTSNAPDGHLQPLWSAMFDPAANAWTRITSSIFTDSTIITPGNNYPGWVFNTPDRRLMSVADRYVNQWEAEATSTTVTTLAQQAPATGQFITCTNDATVGTIPWSNPNFAQQTDGSCATAALNSIQLTEYLKTTNFGFSIPGAATITGIQMSVWRFASDVNIEDNIIKLYKAGTIVGTDHSTFGGWPTSPGLATYGGPSDLWGTTWTPSDINNSGFGVAFSAWQHATPPVNETASVDSISLTVYYTLSNVTQQQSFVKAPALYDTDVNGHFQPIPFLWRTKLLPVVGTTSMTRKRAQLKRWITDYIFQGNGLPSVNGFTVTLKDASGNVISDANAQKILGITNNSTVNSSISGGAPNAATSIQRAQFDCWAEVLDFCFEVAWIDAQQTTSPSAVVADLYTVGVEFQHTSEMH